MKLNLAELKKRFENRSVLAITIESGCVALSFVRREETGVRLEQSLSVPLGADEILKNPAAVGIELSTALESAGIRERRAVVCVPPGWALTASADLPEVSPDDLRSFFELRAERELPVSASEVRLSHCCYSMPDGKRRATLAAVPVKRMEALEKMFEAAGCTAVSVSLALDKCLDDPRATLHFLANGNHTDAVVTAGGGVVAMRSLAGPAGGGDTAFDPAAFCREIRITLGRLPEPMRKQLHHARFAGNSESANRLRLSIGAQLERMGLQSSAPDAAVECPEAAVESASHWLAKEPVAFEFIVPETHRWKEVIEQFDTKRRRWIVVAVAMLVVLPVLAFFVRSRIESRLGSRWEAMRKNVAELEALQQKIRRFRPWFEPAPQNLQLLQSLVAAFPEQGDVWAKSVQVGEGSKVTCTGFAHSQQSLSALLDRLRARPDIKGVSLQSTRGDNPIQFSITYKWEPSHETQ